MSPLNTLGLKGKIHRNLKIKHCSTCLQGYPAELPKAVSLFFPCFQILNNVCYLYRLKLFTMPNIFPTVRYLADFIFRLQLFLQLFTLFFEVSCPSLIHHTYWSPFCPNLPFTADLQLASAGCLWFLQVMTAVLLNCQGTIGVHLPA